MWSDGFVDAEETMGKRSWRYEGVGEEFGTREGRRFVASLALSLAILTAGIAWTLRVGAECGKLNHRLAHADDALEEMRQIARVPAATKGRAQ